MFLLIFLSLMPECSRSLHWVLNLPFIPPSLFTFKTNLGSGSLLYNKGGKMGIPNWQSSVLDSDENIEDPEDRDS